MDTTSKAEAAGSSTSSTPKSSAPPDFIAAAMSRYFTAGMDLSSLLRPDWWRTLFDAVYLRTDGDVVEDVAITSAECRFVSSALGLSAGMHVLDLCCGQGRHALELARTISDLDVVGLDQSAYLVRLAQERTPSSLSDRVRFLVGDCRNLPFPDGYFDCVILMGNSFGYFENAAQDNVVLSQVARVLKYPTGRILIDVTDGDHMRASFSPRSWEIVDDKMYVIRARQLGSDGDTLISREVVFETNSSIDPAESSKSSSLVRDAVYAERLYSEDKMSSILRTSGFLSPRRAGHLLTGEMSKREEQDLGMMERRIVMIADAPIADESVASDAESPLVSTNPLQAPCGNDKISISATSSDSKPVKSY